MHQLFVVWAKIHGFIFPQTKKKERAPTRTMRLWAVLNALAFRGVSRIVPGSDEELRVRLGVQSLMAVCRPEIRPTTLPADPDSWSACIAEWQRGGPGETVLRKIWTNTRGGVGARDIWDVARNVVARELTEESFVALASLHSIATLAIGGAYGRSVGIALKRAMERHLPEADVSANQLTSAAGAHVSGTELPVVELAKRYLLQLSLGVNIRTDALFAGVLNHFLRWCGESSGRRVATYDDVVEEMRTRDALARNYLASCEETNKVRVSLGGRDEESAIALGLTGTHRSDAKMDGGIVAMVRYAENLWEKSIYLQVD